MNVLTVLMKPACISSLLILSACTVSRPEKPDDPYFAPKVVPTAARSAPQDGSLYTDAGLDLFSDRKARRAGDIITIVLKESTVSQKKSNLNSSKNTALGLENPTILGAPLGLGKLDLNTELNGKSEFKGKGDAAQSNNLQGNISVTVSDILPNGVLVVRGEKWLTLNRGDEYIRISGMVRPDDIGPDNTVLSTRVANARISYSGTGAMADGSQMGWLSRFFNSGFWPF
ncbi:MAG TPA: flagellar basal body L-ring protein FlgH [Cellvibrionaceae bacterium]|jgi:flagellar L-ring protein FlgH